MAVEFIEVAIALYEARTLQKGKFTLASGRRSSSYWNLANLKSFPNHRNVVVNAYQQILDECSFNCLADVPTASTFMTAILSDRLQVSMVTPREPKDHGFITEVEGSYKKGEIAVVIEGVLTTGRSALAAIKRLERNGLVVQDIVGLIDAEKGNKETLAGYRVHTFTTHDRLIDFYQEALINA